MLYYDNDRERKEAIQAKCRRLERAGYKIFSVQYGNVDLVGSSFFRPLMFYGSGYFDDTKPKIRVYK